MRSDLAGSEWGAIPAIGFAEDEIVDLLARAGEPLTAEQAEAVEAILLSTSSAKIRNAAALALLDARHQGLDSVLNRVLARPAVASVAGTLLFCLLEMSADISASVVPLLVRSGSFETRSELLMLTSRGSVRFDGTSDSETLLAELRAIAGSDDHEAAEVAAMALEDVAGLHRSDGPS